MAGSKSLVELLEELKANDARNDLDGLRRVREVISESYPDTVEACEALYKLGLDALFRARDMDAAIERFAAAAKLKKEYWSPAARTSLALCYQRQGNTQRAVFELRRVGYVDTPSAHSTTALMFLENIFTEEGQEEDVTRVRNERIAQLRRVAAAEENPAHKGLFLFHLGTALLDAGDDSGAREALGRARDIGPDALGRELFNSISGLLG